MDKDKLLSTGEFLDLMRERGLWSNRFSLYDYEKKGKLTLARTPSGRRAISVQDAEEIIREFSPGGSGEWHYKQED